MAVREIITEGNPLLRKKSKKVRDFGDDLWRLLNDMTDTLLSTEDGCGISAIQIGVPLRVALIQIDKDRHCLEMINPKIFSKKGKQTLTEGCLSLPGKSGVTERSQTVVVHFRDREGKFKSFTMKNFFAAEVEHELDHMDGILYTDRLAKGETVHDNSEEEVE